MHLNFVLSANSIDKIIYNISLIQFIMNKLYYLVMAALIAAFTFVPVSIAQENQEPNRLSIGLMGGVTMGHMNIGTEYDPTFGFNLRYAANPTFALQTNFLFGKFTSSDEDGYQNDKNYFDRHFENSYFITSVTSQINMLRLLGSKSETVNLYGIVGLGLIFNNVTTETRNQIGAWEQFKGEDHSETAYFATFGTGLRFNLGRRVDLFAQYDFNISNDDLIDGHRTRPEMDIDLHRRTKDSWSSLTAGIQIKLGSSDKDADWHTYTPGVNMASFNRLENKVTDLDSRVGDNTSRIDEQEKNTRALESRMTELERKLSNLEQLVAGMDRVELTIDSDILFAFDSSSIREGAKPTLARIIRVLANSPDKTITVTGHTCDIGTESYNQGLSERRANAVKQYMVASGISASRIQTAGRGETQPLVPNISEEARMLNRRVELVIE
jgi:outer membrane protein OmpA-like peptidoglycan-associated protein